MSNYYHEARAEKKKLKDIVTENKKRAALRQEAEDQAVRFFGFV